MANHDPHEVPDVTISGVLAMEILDILTWARFHAGTRETTALTEILRARYGLSTEILDVS